MISVIIPLYNKEKNVKRTLESVLAQSYTDFEVVVVDDGSTDGSAYIVKEVMNHDARIRLIGQPNTGVSATRNRGIREAKNDLVALIDADDFWDRECLAEMVKMTEDFPKAAIWGVNSSMIINGEERPFNHMPKGFRGYVENFFVTAKGDLYCSSSVMLRREAAIAVGMFDERIRIAEDLDMWYRLILNYPVAFNDKVLAYYNKDAENRAEGQPKRHYEITTRMDFFIEKFVPYFKSNNIFANYLGIRVAANLLDGHYYFGDKYDRRCSDKVVKFLSYKDIPYKYTLIFKTPRPIGWCIYRLSLLKKRICR